MTELENKVREEVGKVHDPETGMTLAEMQMITNVKEEKLGIVKVEFIPTSLKATNFLYFLLFFCFVAVFCV